MLPENKPKNNLTEYNWWGEKNAPPENLKTKNQLSELGLKPVNARGIIHTKKYDVLLYDITDSDSVRKKKPLTEKQIKSLKDREFKKNYEYYLIQNHRTIKAKIRLIKLSTKILSSPDNYLIMNVKSYCHQITELCLVTLSGSVIYNQHYEVKCLNDYWTLRLSQENLIKWGNDTDTIKQLMQDKMLIVANGDHLIKSLDWTNRFDKTKHKHLRRFIDFNCCISTDEGYADEGAFNLIKVIENNREQKINFPLKYRNLALKEHWFKNNQDLFELV